MRLIAVQEFQMYIAARLIREPLKKLSRQPKPEGGRHILLLFDVGDPFVRQIIQPPPNEVRPATEINYTTRQTFVHGYVRFASRENILLDADGAFQGGGCVLASHIKWILRLKPGPIPPYPFFVAERLQKRLAQRNPAIFDRMMRIHLQIPLAPQLQIDNRMPREQRQHVIEKRNPGLDGCASY